MTEEKKYNGWKNQATWNMNLKLNNDEPSYNQLMYLAKKFPEPMALRQAIIEHFGYEEHVDYQEIAEATLEE